MTMLPVCSATTSCSHSQIWSHGGLMPFSSYRKTVGVRYIVEDRVVLGWSNGINFRRVSSNSYSLGAMSGQHAVGMRDLKFVVSSSVSAVELEPADFIDQATENANILSKFADPQTMTTPDVIPSDPISVSDSLNIDADSLSSLKTNMGDILAGINESISASVNKGEYALRNSLETITSTITSSFGGANEAVDSAISKVVSVINQSGESAVNTFTGFSNDSKEASSRAGVVAVDVLRHAIVAVEDSLAQGATFVLYAYGSIKEVLPPEIQDVLEISEEKATKVLGPVGTAFGQVSIVLEGLERSLGLDPSDPIVPFLLFLGTSGILWGSYLVLTYGGYAGDLSPKSTLELLTGKESVVLIDVRPEDFRERDGIPDLRRAARSRYASVTLSEVDGSVRKLLKSEKDLVDTMIAAVIRNLKIVQDRSKVVVMDADGTRSKGIARSLSKLGIQRSYLVQGGFRSWVKEGLRIKELKRETTITILNEEAEAILEEVNLTPLKVLGYGVGFTAAAYALLEWEKTLQLTGVVGLGLTIYWRVASYENSEDFKQDVRLLLAPVRLGGEAISWAAGKLEANRNGLPTSPSSSDVQSRVLQAAAKHESQPSDSEEIQDLPPESVFPVKENVDLSEA